MATLTPPARVTLREFDEIFDSVRNWGRWGPDDELGTLNYVTKDTVRAAAALVRSGRRATMAIPMNTIAGPDNPSPVIHHVVQGHDIDIGSSTVTFATDFLGLAFHGDCHTHMDALCHIAYKGLVYNGRPAQEVMTSRGATALDVTTYSDGLVGKGVLLDVPRFRGVKWLEPGEAVTRAEKALIITGTIEIVIMVALAFTALASPGPGGFSFAPLNPGNFGLAGNLFLGVVFSIFAFSGWESTGPLAEESKNPKRNVPIGLVGSVIVLMIYFTFVTWGYLVGIGVKTPIASITNPNAAFPVATMAQRVWGGAWVLLLFALLNSAIALSIACFNGGTRTWYGMGRSGVLPTALGKVNPKRKTPINAIHVEVGMQVVAFLCVLIFGVANVFFSWANAITIGLVLMYILCNIGVVKYYLTEGRAQFNPLLHLTVPVVASAAGVVVVWKSYFSPFTSTGPVYWGLMVFIAVLALTVIILVYLRVRGQEDWMRRAQLVFEQSGGGH